MTARNPYSALSKHALSKHARRTSSLTARLVALVAITLVAAACAGTSSPAQSTSGTTPTVTTAPATVVPSTSRPGTTGAASSAAVPATHTGSAPASPLSRAALQKDLGAVIAKNPHIGAGTLTCPGGAVLSDWQAITCTYTPNVVIQLGGIYVTVLDHHRYAWTYGECCEIGPNADRYPSGLMCTDLRKPPPGLEPGHFQPEYDHLGYGAVVWYWIHQGRPAGMDADGNGIPCESAYPASEVKAFWASVRVVP